MNLATLSIENMALANTRSLYRVRAALRNHHRPSAEDPMCPVCLAAAALFAVKATSGSALAALAYRKIYGKPLESQNPTQSETKPETKEEQHVQHHDRN
jgi:hypothetical protein